MTREEAEQYVIDLGKRTGVFAWVEEDEEGSFRVVTVA